ncbi:conserved hypothetical protein [Trichormus variabilis ATCC 29413]|uniref:DnaD domain-containing protein n=3 Tax=Nostocaceae TaxID=1162 RepID=Q3M5B0_TRIV2|nr:conserved hypothetical protein [Trichormus variabilis ATCC 29413]MBC1216324.1 hypothetical protein [Trichormus variabilis ARAD]MBC1258172.1 hypothetical protein [Trichormus variabilis V5]MBC1267168.1 hypothetical protein [Trichormus variabilis FSR]MBC1300396.1 hypothetical protein [Trichormus variabilis N2B]MBC1311114.1 hypothetical protein [Trichormus variabilis PNB]MBC1324993.1 hypothetical protein [Trichormus variabilis 9RC]MBD2381017.1 hypothetical protein [Trichormus variabilis FACHB
MRWVDDSYLLPAAKGLMSTSVPNTYAKLAKALLINYSFDLSGYHADELVNRWQKQYPADWLHLAVIEALYQGRYKAISVQQLLAFWQRRGQEIYHFNMEFERLICSKFPESLTPMAAPEQYRARQGNNQNQTLQLMSFKQQEQVKEEEKPPTEKMLALSSASMTASIEVSLSQQEDYLSQPFSLNPDLSTKLLPISVTHPPIGQFTPQTSDRSESFTSKLKAISNENP